MNEELNEYLKAEVIPFLDAFNTLSLGVTTNYEAEEDKEITIDEHLTLALIMFVLTKPSECHTILSVLSMFFELFIKRDIWPHGKIKEFEFEDGSIISDLFNDPDFLTKISNKLKGTRSDDA